MGGLRRGDLRRGGPRGGGLKASCRLLRERLLREGPPAPDGAASAPPREGAAASAPPREGAAPSGPPREGAAASGPAREGATAPPPPQAPLAPLVSTAREIDAHLEACPGCASFARRLALARQALARAGCETQPDTGFAARVIGRLPRSSDLLGWAALRALPAAVLLALALAGFGASDVPPPTTLLFDEPSSSQLLAWSAQGQRGDLR
jgi:hypothetical protein